MEDRRRFDTAVWMEDSIIPIIVNIPSSGTARFLPVQSRPCDWRNTLPQRYSCCSSAELFQFPKEGGKLRLVPNSVRCGAVRVSHQVDDFFECSLHALRPPTFRWHTQQCRQRRRRRKRRHRTQQLETAALTCDEHKQRKALCTHTVLFMMYASTTLPP
mmetsp:Transcript_20050/g.22185  ORF Transcript_20050/g.22185 Transcript_20050/m.22185 type:complete len:159 (-) Transcript_20050:228-704(-)